MSFIIYIIFVSPLVYFASRKMSMSFWWGMFFTIFYSLIPGLIIIRSSGKKGYSMKYKHKGTSIYNIKTIACFVIGAFFIIYGFSNLNSYQYEYNLSGLYSIIGLGIGLAGNCIYLLSDMDEEYFITESN